MATATKKQIMIDASQNEVSSSGSSSADVDIKFSHIQLYADHLSSVAEYKKLEGSLNEFDEKFHPGEAATGSNYAAKSSDDIDNGRRLWNTLRGVEDTTDNVAYVPHGRDVVKQLIAGLGFRITGCYPSVGINDASSSTNSVLVTSSDPNGIQILVTSVNKDAIVCDTMDEYYHHFDASNVEKFYNAHSGRQGIAVLAFEVGPGCLEQIFQRYSKLHPALLPDEYKESVKVYEKEAKVLEVFAYYMGEKNGSMADEGTRLRFVEPIGIESSKCHLPGIVDVPAEFRSCYTAYFDHWVSNVVSRTGFLDTLEDVLLFTPKVDFNAGVVAAGEAQIESTVTGNSSKMTTEERDRALKDQSQIYLPINNALTEVGHVHGFIKEIGQGVQHIASRVGNIIDFVQQANDRRKILGEGFTFLNIPRSYYGILQKDMLVKGVQNEMESSTCSKELLSVECASAVFDTCVSEGLLNNDYSLILDTTEDSISEILDSKVPGLYQEEYSCNRDEVVKTILHSRYVNLYRLLKDHLTEDSYVAVVRNQILVDVQGQDLLFQIFTSNILQRQSGDEAPFFEFIQRVCSECIGVDGCPRKIKPGCGGFGIRNFLTLFLSIEVTKAYLEASNAKEYGDNAKYAFAQRKVELFTQQLNESNPLLTEISDAMTREGTARDKISAASSEEEKKEDSEKWKLEMEKESLAKMRANEKLMECNLKYQALMKELRESQGK